MAWTGLGCFIQCINSIIWNHNMIDRAPIYSDIGKLDNIAHRHSLNYITVVHIQAGLNAAIPACSLCINRRLYKIATAKVVMATPSENRRAVIIDLFIGIGIPILLMALSSIEIFGTIPLGTYWIVSDAKQGVGPWKSWAYQHGDYSRVIQVPDFMWKNEFDAVVGLEVYRWSLVLCASIFFAFFGFAEEARQHYR